jgi:GDP-L-fucose synthase
MNEIKILVTGSNGLVGKSLQKIVKEQLKKNEKNRFYFLTRKECNLIDLYSVYDIFKKIKPDIVIHLASVVGGVYENMNNNYNMFMNNTRMHLNIIDACEKFNIKKLINILSTCVFPDQGVTYPLTPEQIHNGPPHFSNNGYAYSKRTLHIGSQLLKNPGCVVINLIPTNLYGENDNYTIEKAHVIPALIHKTYNAIINETDLKINGSGNALRQFLYADDLTNIIYSYINSSEQSGDYIVSPPPSHEISIKQLVNKIVNIFDYKGKIIYDTDEIDGQMKKTAYSNIDYEFTNLDIGLTRTIHYFTVNYNNLRI